MPDFRRCERIRWVRAFIENYNCDTIQCEGIKVWSKPYRSTTRVHMLLKEECYMVVLEQRASYCLLIMAFYFEQDYSLRKKLHHYEQYKVKYYKQEKINRYLQSKLIDKSQKIAYTDSSSSAMCRRSS